MDRWYSQHPNVHAPDPGSADRIAKSLALIRSLSPKSVVDVGCGTGTIAARIHHETGANVVGFDISASAVAESRKRGVEAHVLDLDRDNLPIPDATIEVVLMAEVIEHVVNPDHALSEIHRVLVPGGNLVLSTPNMACLINRIMVPLGLQPFHTEVSTKVVIGRRFGFLGEGAEPVGHLRIATYRALRQLLKLNGFTVRHAEGATVLARPAFRAVESLLNWTPSVASIVVLIAAKS
jgi:ubiquinone/menaquinone biosynthesis C-methylase UbiE